MLILLLDDINIINFLHVKFFRNNTHHFYCIITSIFKKRNFRKLINKLKLHPSKNKNNNIKFLSNKNTFLYISMNKDSTQYFIKILKEIKYLLFFKVIKRIN